MFASRLGVGNGRIVKAAISSSSQAAARAISSASQNGHHKRPHHPQLPGGATAIPGYITSRQRITPYIVTAGHGGALSTGLKANHSQHHHPKIKLKDMEWISYCVPPLHKLLASLSVHSVGHYNGKAPNDKEQDAERERKRATRG